MLKENIIGSVKWKGETKRLNNVKMKTLKMFKKKKNQLSSFKGTDASCIL